jgi:hypothetical protein
MILSMHSFYILMECSCVVVGVIYKETYSYNIFHECLLVVVQTSEKILSDEKTDNTKHTIVLFKT